MSRLIWPAVAVALAACGTEEDQRPRTVEYITQAILAPNCGNAQCHSSFRKAEGYVFDTVEQAKLSLAGGLVGAVAPNVRGELEGDGASSLLFHVLTRPVDRMPWDQPLPDADIDLIVRWIDFGAPGAQCNPAITPKVCFGDQVYECQPSSNFLRTVDCGVMGMTCSMGACRP
jgi:hypothetical protein